MGQPLIEPSCWWKPSGLSSAPCKLPIWVLVRVSYVRGRMRRSLSIANTGCLRRVLQSEQASRQEEPSARLDADPGMKMTSRRLLPQNQIRPALSSPRFLHNSATELEDHSPPVLTRPRSAVLGPLGLDPRVFGHFLAVVSHSSLVLAMSGEALEPRGEPLAGRPSPTAFPVSWDLGFLRRKLRQLYPGRLCG